MPLIPDSKVARERYGVTLRTLARWDDNPALDFPKAKVINKRKYRDDGELDAFDRCRPASVSTGVPRNTIHKPKSQAEMNHHPLAACEANAVKAEGVVVELASEELGVA